MFVCKEDTVEKVKRVRVVDKVLQRGSEVERGKWDLSQTMGRFG